MTPALLALIAYLAAQLAIGVWVSRRIRTETDYLVAGRQLGYALATFSIFATWFGAETVIGSGGRAYAEGISLANAEPFGYGLCLVLMGAVFAVPLWRRKLTTLADLFRQRYSVTVERTAALILIPSSILWAAAQIRAFGQVLSLSSAGLELEAALAFAAGFTILYTAFGGLLADAITDVIQGALLAIGLGVLLLVALTHGTAEMVPGVAAAPMAAATAEVATSWLALLEEWAIPVCGSVIATELVGRVIATRTPQIARNSSIIAGGAYVLIGCIPLWLGLFARSLSVPLGHPEQAIPAVAQALLPGALFGVFAGALISAILSTVDSTLLVSAGLLSHNLLVPALRIQDERVRVRLARAAVLGFGVAAYLLARISDSVLSLVEQASAFGSAGALVTVCFGLFTAMGGPATALVTLVGSTLTYIVAAFGGLPYPFLASLGAALLLYLAGSTLEPATVPGVEQPGSFGYNSADTEPGL